MLFGPDTAVACEGEGLIVEDLTIAIDGCPDIEVNTGGGGGIFLFDVGTGCSLVGCNGGGGGGIFFFNVAEA